MSTLHESTLLGATVTTGGTRPFGKTMVNHLLAEGAGTIHALSRDEAKQDEMRQFLGDPWVKHFIGDVRDRHSVDAAMTDTDFVVHTTALKPLPLIERNPLEGYKTNVQSALNVLQAAFDHGVEAVPQRFDGWRRQADQRAWLQQGHHGTAHSRGAAGDDKTPAKINDVTTTHIDMSGRHGIEGIYTGLRPVENPSKELVTPGEDIRVTDHSLVSSIHVPRLDAIEVAAKQHRSTTAPTTWMQEQSVAGICTVEKRGC